MVFANIEYLFLLLLLIPYIVWYIMRRKNSEATLQISDARVYAHAHNSFSFRLQLEVYCQSVFNL